MSGNCHRLYRRDGFNVSELPEWPVYEKDTRLAMFINAESHVGEIEFTDPNISTQTLRL